MPTPIANCFFGLLCVAFSLGAVAEASTNRIAPLSTNLIQRVVLNPMKVTHVPVARDRLTTIRFPSPMSDLASALVATEMHPSAQFLLSFQPGESFFSLRALAPNASTTLNVVWKSQTYVFAVVESTNPWLSVVMVQPEVPRQNTTSPSLALRPSPWAQFLESAKAYHSLKRRFPTSMPEVQVWALETYRDFHTYALRTEQLFLFRNDAILVMRVSILNKTPSPLHFGPDPFRMVIGKEPVPVLLTDFSGTVPGGANSVAFVVVGCVPTSGARVNLAKDPIRVTLNAPSLPGGTAANSTVSSGGTGVAAPNRGAAIRPISVNQLLQSP